MRALHRADALVAVAEAYLAATPRREAGPPVEMIVHIESTGDAETGDTLDDGRGIARATAERPLCDATVVAVRDDVRGNAAEIGRRRRTIPTVLRRALHLRDERRADYDLPSGR